MKWFERSNQSVSGAEWVTEKHTSLSLSFLLLSETVIKGSGVGIRKVMIFLHWARRVDGVWTLESKYIFLHANHSTCSAVLRIHLVTDSKCTTNRDAKEYYAHSFLLQVRYLFCFMSGTTIVLHEFRKRLWKKKTLVIDCKQTQLPFQTPEGCLAHSFLSSFAVAVYQTWPSPPH